MTLGLASRLHWAVGRWLAPRRRIALVTVMTLDVGVGVVAVGAGRSPEGIERDGSPAG